MVANMIKQNASMFGADKQKEVAEIIDMNQYRKTRQEYKRIGCSYIKIGFSDNSFIFYSIAMDQNAMSF